MRGVWFEAIWLCARKESAAIAALSRAFLTLRRAKSVKSFGRQNGCNLGQKLPWKGKQLSRRALSPDIIAILTPRPSI